MHLQQKSDAGSLLDFFLQSLDVNNKEVISNHLAHLFFCEDRGIVPVILIKRIFDYDNRVVGAKILG